MALHDAELIQRTLAGEESAFGFLVDKYKGSVHALAYRKLGDFHIAEDITQDTFLKAYQKLSTLKDPARFPGWLYVIAARCCISWLRQNRVQTESFDNVEGEIDLQSWAKYDDARVREKVQSALENLPESERTVLTLYYMAGMTCEEIGRFIGTSCGAIRDRLYRARIRLKEELTMIEHTLGGFQLPSTLTQEIMRRIPKIPLTSGQTSKPLVPWIAATTLAAVMLLVGFGVTTTRFQSPYSLNAPESATMVEIVDAPIIETPVAKFLKANRTGAANAEAAKNGNRENGSVWAAAADSQNDMESDKSGWTQTNGPYGGHVTALHATPEGMLFAGTYEAGVFRSTDSGETWAPVNGGLRVYVDKIIPNILAFAQKGDTLYAGTMGDLFYSTNGGDSWRQMTRLKDGGVRAVAFINDALYIGRREKGVFRSDDDGESWTPINDGLIDRDIQRLIVSGRTLFAKTPNDVFRLKAGESSWTKLVIVDAWNLSTAESDITGFTVSGEIIYAATADGDLLRSRDMGDWWKSIKPKKAIQHFSGELAAVGNTIVHIGSGSADGRVFRSNDAGSSWKMFNTSLINQSIQSMAALSEKTLYVGTDEGVFRSTNGGKSWTKINAGIINTYIESLVFFRNALYAMIEGDGIVKSVDGGNSWVPANDGLIATYGGMLTVSGGKLYAATHETNFQLNPSTSGIYRLADDGNSWLPIQTKMQSPNNRIYRVNQLTVSGGTFYVIGQMGEEGRIYRWRVGEDLWTALSPQISDWWLPLSVSGRIVFVSTKNGKFLRSVDEGDTWTDMSQNFTIRAQKNRIYNFIFVGETIYANSNDGVFRSRDDGDTWTSIADGTPEGANNIIELVDGTTFYGTNYLGVFRLTHGSDSWEKLASMMPTYVPSRYVTSLAIDGTTLYAGTQAEGVFRLSLDK